MRSVGFKVKIESVYSLVLADDVVEAIDRMAYSMNTSRSNLINQILAERVQLLTPEKRMREIFAKIEQLMDSRIQTLNQPSDAMMSIKSPLRYKYKPTIRYSIELSRDFHGKVGRLKVSFRTQNTIYGFGKPCLFPGSYRKNLCVHGVRQRDTKQAVFAAYTL